jgi:hypothetical protein
MTRRRWVGRAGLVAFVVAVVWVIARIEHTRPDALRLILFVAVGIAVLGLLIDTAVIAAPDWEVSTAFPVVPAGQDPAVSRYVRMLENHLTTRGLDPVVQMRLTRLTDDRLGQLGMARGDPGVRERLGPLLTDVIEGRTRQLSRTELDECIRRIEELSP